MVTKRTGLRTGRSRTVMLALAALLFIAAGCGGQDAPAKMDDETLKRLVADLAAGKAAAAAASISSTELIITGEDGKRTVYGLPKDEFFVSIAPYYETTHPCAIHSLTGCRGELPDTAFDLVIEEESGAKVLEMTVVTPHNGFIDLWLPRNKTFRVTISRDGRSAVSTLSTFEGDPTCITTMQLL